MFSQSRRSFIDALFGGIREQCLGIKVVSGDGRVYQGGGNVVKNVSAYDLVRLNCGAAGHLGVIEELCFRLRPMPESTMTFCFCFDSLLLAWQSAMELRQLGNCLAAMVILKTGNSDEVKLYLKIEGSAESIKTAEASLQKVPAWQSSIAAAEETDLWNGLESCSMKAGGSTLCLRFLVSKVLPAMTAMGLDIESDFMIDVLNGRVNLLSDATWAHDDEVIQRYAAVCKSFQGRAALASNPDDLRKRFQFFPGPSTAEQKLSERIKTVFDPKSLLSRGRIMAGDV
jgi:glycolate oxidase FAD binding subunit